MTIIDLRKSLSLSQEAFAVAVGLTSKSYVSELESAAEPRCSVKVALEIERLSEGKISAASLNPDVGLVRQANEASGQAAA
jgi:DNA-binding XRE family transcriptional regulator